MIRDSALDASRVAFSTHGKHLAFSATAENWVTKLYARPSGPDDTQSIAGTEDAAMQSWSSDRACLGFFAVEKLKTVNLRGADRVAAP
jgi:hypothetical protein